MDNNRISAALIATLFLCGCNADCSDHDDNSDYPPVDLTAPDGKHIARIGEADCGGFRVETIGRVRIRAIFENAKFGTVVFQNVFETPRVEWIDARHLLITLVAIEKPNVSLDKAQGVTVKYHLDRDIFTNYVESKDRISAAAYDEFVKWAEVHIDGYQSIQKTTLGR